MKKVIDEYIVMCREAYPFMPVQKPHAWERWVFRQEHRMSHEPNLLIKVVSGYTTDSGVYGPGVKDNCEMEMDGWIPQYPVWTVDQLHDMVDDSILQTYLDPTDKSKSIYIKRLMALNLWLTKWLAVPDKPVAILFLNMTAEQLWLSFIMFHKHKVMWNGQTQVWQDH